MYTYLALGDSYTIGESVPIHDNFPHQVVKMLVGQHFDVADPELSLPKPGGQRMSWPQLLRSTTCTRHSHL